MEMAEDEDVRKDASSDLERLPNELLAYMFFELLHPTDLLPLSAVCRRWRALLRGGEGSGGLWRSACLRRWSAGLWTDSRLVLAADIGELPVGGGAGEDWNALAEGDRLCPLAWQKVYMKLDAIGRRRVDRLLLVEAMTNKVFIIAPDGSDKHELSSAAGGSRSPMFSPHGDKVLWVEINGRRFPRGRVCVADTSGRKPVKSWDVDFMPFFAYFAPCGTRVALLANDPIMNTIQLLVFDLLGNEQSARTISTGRPYYFTWAPDKLSLLAKKNMRQLERVEIDPSTGDLRSIVQLPVEGKLGSFATPAWVGTAQESGEDTFMYAVRDTTCQRKGQKLVVATLSTLCQNRSLGRIQSEPLQHEMNELCRVASFREDTLSSFILSRDRQKVAYALDNSGSLYVSAVKRPSCAPDPPLGGPHGEHEEERVMAATKDRIAEFADTVRLLAYFWSPNGRYLLYLVLDYSSFGYNLQCGVVSLSLLHFEVCVCVMLC